MTLSLSLSLSLSPALSRVLSLSRALSLFLSLSPSLSRSLSFSLSVSPPHSGKATMVVPHGISAVTDIEAQVALQERVCESGREVRRGGKEVGRGACVCVYVESG